MGSCLTCNQLSPLALAVLFLLGVTPLLLVELAASNWMKACDKSGGHLVHCLARAIDIVIQQLQREAA